MSVSPIKAVTKESFNLPERARPYIDALGADAAMRLFLRFGGGIVYVSDNTGPDSNLAAAIGADGARALARAMGIGHVRVPLAKAWCARQMSGKGMGQAEIARELRCTNEAVRLMLKGFSAGQAEPIQSRQLSLFGD